MTKSRSQQRCSLLDFYLWVKLTNLILQYHLQCHLQYHLQYPAFIIREQRDFSNKKFGPY